MDALEPCWTKWLGPWKWLLLKGNPSNDASWPENLKHAQISLCASMCECVLFHLFHVQACAGVCVSVLFHFFHVQACVCVSVYVCFFVYFMCKLCVGVGAHTHALFHLFHVQARVLVSTCMCAISFISCARMCEWVCVCVYLNLWLLNVCVKFVSA